MNWTGAKGKLCPCGPLFQRFVRAGLLLGLWLDRSEIAALSTRSRPSPVEDDGDPTAVGWSPPRRSRAEDSSDEEPRHLVNNASART